MPGMMNDYLERLFLYLTRTDQLEYDQKSRAWFILSQLQESDIGSYEGHVIAIWHHHEHTLELEINPRGILSFFYSNTFGDFWYLEYDDINFP